MTNSISWIALIIAILSLLINFYRIFRDRSKLIAWAEIAYHDNEEPKMHIYAINKGLRPINLTQICTLVTRKKWSCKAIEPSYDTENTNFTIGGDKDNISISELKNILTEANLAHKSSLRLDDGDIYESIINYQEYHLYHCTHEDYKLGTKMFFKDILGVKYNIKGAKKAIKILVNYKG